MCARAQRLAQRREFTMTIFVLLVCLSFAAGQGDIIHAFFTNLFQNVASLEISVTGNVVVFEGQDAVFSCTTPSVPGHWRLNDTNIADLPSLIRADLANETVQSGIFYFIVLSIAGKAVYSGTTVQCAVEDGDVLRKSGVATFIIQGNYVKLYMCRKVLMMLCIT